MHNWMMLQQIDITYQQYHHRFCKKRTPLPGVGILRHPLGLVSVSAASSDCAYITTMRNPNFDPLRFVSLSRVSDERRRMLVAEAAYFRSLQRSPGHGNPIDDWLAAEAEVEAKLLFRSHRIG